MKHRNLEQRGFSIIEVSVVVLVVCLLAAVGYFVYQRNEDSKASNAQSSTSQPSGPAQDSSSYQSTEAPQITKTSDLGVAETSLDSVNLDSEQLDKDLDSSLNF